MIWVNASVIAMAMGTISANQQPLLLFCFFLRVRLYFWQYCSNRNFNELSFDLIVPLMFIQLCIENFPSTTGNPVRTLRVYTCGS